MRRMLLAFSMGIVLICGATSVAPAFEVQPSIITCAYISDAQDQEKTWTVIEYPVGTEVTVEFKSTAAMPEAKGIARVMRGPDETAIQVDISGVTGDATSYKLYAVDHSGMVHLLGELPNSQGASTISVKTPLSKFMLVLSPESDLTAIGVDTPVVLRSTVPDGFEVVPMTSSEAEHAHTDQPSKDAAIYDTPMLGISELKRGADTILKIDFAGEMETARANVFVKPQKDGVTQIKAHFYNLKPVSENARYILWAVNADNTYTRLGRIDTKGKHKVAKVEVKTSLPDFGLFITAEGADTPSSPTGALVARLIR